MNACGQTPLDHAVDPIARLTADTSGAARGANEMHCLQRLDWWMMGALPLLA